MTSGTAAQACAEWSAALSYSDVPSQVMDRVKYHILDAVGCALAARGTHAAKPIADVLGSRPTAGRATVIGDTSRRPAAAAALVNGALCHALDFDDTHLPSVCHITSVVFPAAFAEAQTTGVEGKSLLTAIVAAAEVMARIGMAASGVFHQRGLHATGICGAFGAAVASGKVTAASADVLANALGIAGSLASGIFEYLADGSDTKPLHAGWAAQSGVNATAFARAGLRGPSTVLEGRFGLYRSYLGAAAPIEERIATLGTEWESGKMSIKAFPSCHAMHTVLDATMAAVQQLSAAAEAGEIEAIDVRVPERSVGLVLEPLSRKIAPRSSYEARFSLPFSLAWELVHGPVGIRTYTAAALRDRRVLDLAKRVTYQVEPFCGADGYPGAVTITLRDGRRIFEERRSGRGDVSQPMTSDEIVAKFRANASYLLPAEVSLEVEREILSLDEADDCVSLFEMFEQAATSIA